MDTPRLLINSETEYEIIDDLVTIGRAPDNDIALAGDGNVSRYHAEIEKRGDDLWVIDLGSFNGTTLNGDKLEGEKPLNDKDEVVLGGTSSIRILYTPDEEEEEEEEEEKEEEAPASEAPAPKKPEAPADEPQGSRIPLMLIIASIAVGLAVIFVAAAALFYFTREDPQCEARAQILKPDRQETIKETTEIEVEITNSECVSRVSYTIEGKEFASSTEPPFSVSIEPSQHPEFGDGLTRNLQVILFDEEGLQINQSNEVAFFIETIETVNPDDEIGDPTQPQQPTGPNVKPPPNTNNPQTTTVSAKDSIQMSAGILKQFSGDYQYKFNPRFLGEVRKKTAEYVSSGYFERAKKYRDVINIAYIREQNLDPPLGYILAMSRSKFQPKNNAQGTGLWRMSNDFVVSNAYNGLCGVETIASASQNCASKASSLYLKALVLNVFEGDVVYAVAAFGMSPGEAEAWKSTLPPDRTDFWNVIKSPKQRAEVVNFFAAGLVAENPQKFGLKNDRPISELYSVFMQSAR